ncbi:aminotransferase [Oceanomicrobium pacificus]|uniref:Aminotransferase class III-fold pyridoxal phosphate-dependent enzyme n=1 Tax=Oceanomicrobium pacificus TaxID=2692916 RepID=A0A6B0TNF5_9RHOB|nr:aminotransferase [Oceanomicrobium pacificus]MXU65396.1 aminotransferase class III-fold pyridoxal phosphate-dependent enzyme [Oceanomicrobium pacificus]
MTDLSNSRTRDTDSLLHPYANAMALKENGVQMISRGEGIRVFDDTGKPYIEAMAGLWCCGLGFNNAELIEAANEQMAKLPYYHIFSGRSHETALELAEKIKALAPGNMARVLYQSSGSEANDTQIKLAWYYNNARGKPQKKKLLSRMKGYHGVTIASASLTGLPYNHRDFDLPLDIVTHLRTPHHWREAEAGESELEFSARLARELEETILAEDPETIAAFIAEPVIGAGGVIVPPEGYFEAVMPVLEKYDILMIADEVITGFGRTGEWFGSQSFGYVPNSISMAKQLTAGFAPLSAVAIREDMASAIEENTGKIGSFGHGFTYGGHPVSCAVGIRTLEIYERDDIPGHVKRVSKRFAAHLDRLADHPLVGQARHAGLMGALELSPDGSTRMFDRPMLTGAKVAAELTARGVICRAIGDSLAFCPPMIITEAEVDELFDPVEDALNAAHDWARSEGLA